jgi:hypothetical protein
MRVLPLLLLIAALPVAPPAIDVEMIAKAKTSTVLWQGRLGAAARESFSASPALVDGRWYYRTDSHLLAIGRR